MSAPQRQLVSEFDLAGARRAVLRYQPASNWVSASRDPTPRMTIGLGFDVSRPDASELLKQVGLDPAAVRSGRMPISDAQMNELFDLTLRAAVRLAHQRVPGFAGILPEQQWALLELIVWLGPDGSEAVFSELELRSLPLTHEPLEPTPWFDVLPEATSSAGANQAAPTSRRAQSPVSSSSAAPAFAAWAGSVTPSVERARRRYESAGGQSFGELPDEVRAILTRVERGVPVSATRCQTTFESFGLLAELVSDDPDLLQAALAMLPPGWRAVHGQPGVQFGLLTDGMITVDGAQVDWASHRGAALLKLGAIVRHHLATEASAFTFVHAGVVDVGGCGIVFPGRSYTGKSTLVAELVRLGATYVSDEYAVLDPSGLVQPFAKPLSIRTGRNDPLGQLVPVPQALVADHPVRAALIVLTSYAPGAQWRPSVHSRAEGAFALLQNTVSARLRPGSALSATSRLARPAVFLAGRRGEASETAPALLETALLQAESSATFVA
jgi:hypothetical protein